MPHNYGYHAGTRKLYGKAIPGPPKPSRYLRTYKLGQYVDIKTDAAQQKGMPHKGYYGKTGVVWNIPRRAVGVIINKQVGGRIKRKKIHVRLEHVRPSNCKADLKARVRANEDYKAAVKKGDAVRKNLKRQPGAPRPGGIISTKMAGGVIDLAIP